MYLYSIYDDRSVYAPPFMAHNDDEAERQFKVLVSDKNTLPGMFPKDFSLWLVAIFDECSGLITPVANGPMLIIRGNDFGGDE